MTWAEFLGKIENQVALVGPLAARARPLVMPTIFVDGGSDFLKESVALTSAPRPVVSVGDGDSATGVLDQQLPARKDFSDLAFALRALPASVTGIEMFGFLGGRRDHELANFGEVHKFLAERSGPAVVNFHGDRAIEVVAFGGGSLELAIEGTFSVLVFAPAHVRISGDCEYKYDGEIAVASSLGLSNEGHGLVRVESASPCFIFLNPTRGNALSS